MHEAFFWRFRHLAQLALRLRRRLGASWQRTGVMVGSACQLAAECQYVAGVIRNLLGDDVRCNVGAL